MVGKVVKIISSIYTVLADKKIRECSIRTSAKKQNIVVGDNVTLEPNEFDSGKYVITNIIDRKNSIPRPRLANIDKLLIVLSKEPKPDLLLVDKLVIYATSRFIEPIIVINKCDICDNDFIKNIQKQYYFLKVFVVSAKSNINIKELIDEITNSFCAVSGQSAVGKSSLLNAIIPNINLTTQGLSRKISRGKHTTRANEIYFNNDIIIADTPGFSSLELDIEYNNLVEYYPEFEDYLGECKYLDCSHIGEGKDCAIITAVKDGKISIERYNRFVEFYKNLKEKWEKKYD